MIMFGKLIRIIILLFKFASFTYIQIWLEEEESLLIYQPTI